MMAAKRPVRSEVPEAKAPAAVDCPGFDARRLVDRSTGSAGVPATVEDTAVLGRVASIVRAVIVAAAN
jgi:hypothetical protein